MNRDKVKFTFPSDTNLVKESFGCIMDFLSDLNLSEDNVYNLKLVFTEAFANAVEYGNRSDPDLDVNIEVIKDNDRIELIVTDEGPGFDYRNIEDCTAEENLTKNGGRGIYLMRKLMDDVIFENDGSRIRLIKHLTNES